MLLAMAMPRHIMVPMSAGTLTVVPVTKSIQTMPASTPGSALTMISGSSHDWKFMAIRR